MSTAEEDGPGTGGPDVTPESNVTPGAGQTDVTPGTGQTDVACADAQSDVTFENDQSDITPEVVRTDVTSDAAVTDVKFDDVQADVISEAAETDIYPETDRSDVIPEISQDDVISEQLRSACEDGQVGLAPENNTEGSEQETRVEINGNSSDVGQEQTESVPDAETAPSVPGESSSGADTAAPREEADTEACEDASGGVAQNSVGPTRAGSCTGSTADALAGTEKDAGVVREDVEPAGVSTDVCEVIKEDTTESRPEASKKELALEDVEASEVNTNNSQGNRDPAVCEGAEGERAANEKYDAVDSFTCGGDAATAVPVADAEASPDVGDTALQRSSSTDQPSQESAGAGQTPPSPAPAESATKEAESPAVEARPRSEPGSPADTSEELDDCGACVTGMFVSEAAGGDASPREGVGQDGSDAADAVEASLKAASAEQVDAMSKLEGSDRDVSEHKGEVRNQSSDVSGAPAGGGDCRPSDIESTTQHLQSLSGVTAELAKVGGVHSHTTQQSEVTEEQREVTEAASAENSGPSRKTASSVAEICGVTGVDDSGSHREQQGVEQKADGDSEDSFMAWLGPYWERQKLRIVMEARRPGNTIASVAKKYGMPRSTLHGQVQRFEQLMQDAGKAVPSELEAHGDSPDQPTALSPVDQAGESAVGVGDGEGGRVSRRSSRNSVDAVSDTAGGSRRVRTSSRRSVSSGASGTVGLRRGSAPLADSGAQGTAGVAVSGRRGSLAAHELQHSRLSGRRSAAGVKPPPPPLPWSVLEARIAKSIGIPLADVERYDRVLISMKCGRKDLAAAAAELGASVERVKAAYVSYGKNTARFMWRSRVPAEDGNSGGRETQESESTGAPGGAAVGMEACPDGGESAEVRTSGSASRPGSACSLEVPRVLLDRSVTEQFIRRQSQSPQETMSPSDGGAEGRPDTEPATCRPESGPALVDGAASRAERHLSTPSEADSEAHPGVPGWQLVYSSDDDVPLSPAVGDDDLEGGDAVLRPVSPRVVSAGCEGGEEGRGERSSPAEDPPVLEQAGEVPGEGSCLGEGPPVLEQVEESLPGEAPREGSRMGEGPPLLEQAEELPPRREPSVRVMSASSPVDEPGCSAASANEPVAGSLLKEGPGGVSSSLEESVSGSLPLEEPVSDSSPLVKLPQESGNGSSPLVESERVSSPAENAVSDSSPVVEEERDFSPVVEPERNSSPVVEQERVSSPVEEPGIDSSPVVEPERNSSPVVEPERVSSPVEEPERSSSPVVELERNSSPVEGPKSDSSLVVEPERISSPVVEPERNSPPVDEPERNSPPVDEPERNSSSAEEAVSDSSPMEKEERNSSPVEEPERNSSPMEEPEKDSSPVVEPERDSSPVVKQERDSSPVKEPGIDSSPVVEPEPVSSPVEEPGSGTPLSEQPGNGSLRMENPEEGSSSVEEPVPNPSVKEETIAAINTQSEEVSTKNDGSDATAVASAVKSDEPGSPPNSSQSDRLPSDTEPEQRQAVGVREASPPAHGPPDRPGHRRSSRESQRQSGERSVSPDLPPRERRGRSSTAGRRSHSRGERSHSRGERSHSRGERSHSRGERRHSDERRGASAERRGRERRSSKHHKKERRESKHRSHSKHAKKKDKKRHKEKKKKMKKERRHWDSGSASEAEEGARSLSQQRGEGESNSVSNSNAIKAESPVSENRKQPTNTVTDSVEEAPSKRQTRAEAKVKASENRACSDSTEPAGNNAEPSGDAVCTKAAESVPEPPPPAGVSTRRTRSPSTADAVAKSPAAAADDVTPPPGDVAPRDGTRSVTSDTPAAQSTASRAAARAAAAEARAAAAAAAADPSGVASSADDTFPAMEEPAATVDGAAQPKAATAGDETVTNMDRAMYAWLLGHMGSKKAAETFGVPKTLLRARRDAMQKEQRQAFVRRMKRFTETDGSGGQTATVVTPRRETRGSAHASAGPAKKGPSFEELMMAPEKMKTPAKATKKPAPGGDSSSAEKPPEVKLLSMEELKLVIADLDACRDQGQVSAQYKICKTWLSKFVEYRAVGKSVSDIHLLYTKTARARRDEENIKVAVSLCVKGHSVKKIARQSNLGLNVLKYHLRKHRGTLSTGSATKDRKPSADPETIEGGGAPAEVKQEEEEAEQPPEKTEVAGAADSGSRRSQRRWKPTDKILDSTQSPVRQSRPRERTGVSPTKPAPSAPSPNRTPVSPKPAPSPYRPGPMSRKRAATSVEPRPAPGSQEAAPGSPGTVSRSPGAASGSPEAAPGSPEPAPGAPEAAPAAVEAPPAAVTDPAQRAELAARAANACDRGDICREEALARHQLTEAEFVEAEAAIHRLVHIKRKLTTVAMRRAVAAVVRGQSQQKVAAMYKVSAMALWKTLKKLREAGLIGQHLGKRRFMGGDPEPAASAPDPGAGGDGPPVAPPASSDLPAESCSVSDAADSAAAAPAAGGDAGGQNPDLSKLPVQFRAAAQDVLDGMTKKAAAHKHGVCRKTLSYLLIGQGIMIRTRRRVPRFRSRSETTSGRSRISVHAKNNPARAAYEAYKSGGLTQSEAAIKYGVTKFRLYYWGKKASLKPRYKSDATASKSSTVPEENSRFDMIRQALKEAESSSASKMSIARKYGMKYFTFMYYWKRQQDGKTLFVGRGKTHVRETSEKSQAAPVFESAPGPLFLSARLPLAVKELDAGRPLQQVAARYNLSQRHLERHHRLGLARPDREFSRSQMCRAVRLVTDHGFKMSRAAALYGLHASEVNRKVLRPPAWIRDFSPEPGCDVTPEPACDVTPVISPEEIAAIDETMKRAVGAVILGKMPAKAASSLHRVSYLELKSLCERLTARYDSSGNVVLEPASAAGTGGPEQEVQGSQPGGSPAVPAAAEVNAAPLPKTTGEPSSSEKTDPRAREQSKLAAESPSRADDGAGVTKLRLTKTAGGSYSSTPVKDRTSVPTGAGAAAVDSLKVREAVERVVLLGEDPDRVAAELKLEATLLSDHCRPHPTPDSYLCTVRDEVFVMYTVLAMMEAGWDVNVDSLAWTFVCFRELSEQPAPPRDPTGWLHLPAIYRRWPELRGEVATEPGAPTAEFETAFVQQLRQVCDEYEVKCSAQVLHDPESQQRRQTREVLPLPVAELPPTDGHVWDNRNGSWILEKDGKQQAFFEVDTILARRQGVGGHEYLIRWKGYTDSWNTWEPEGNLECTTTLASFTDRWEALSAQEQRRTIEELSPVPGMASAVLPAFPPGAPASPGRRRGRGRYRGRGRGQRTLDSMLARRDASTSGAAQSPGPSSVPGRVRVRSDLTAAASGDVTPADDVTAVTSDAETEERRSGRSTKSKANALFKEWLLSPKQITAQAMRDSLQSSAGAGTPDATPRPEPAVRSARTPAPAATSTPLTERARRRPNLSLARVLPPAAGQRVLDEFVSRSPSGGAGVAVMGRRPEEGVGTRTAREKSAGDDAAAAPTEEEKETGVGDVSKTDEAATQSRLSTESEVGKKDRKLDRKVKSPRRRSSEARADKRDASPPSTPVKERAVHQGDAQREGVSTRKGSSARKPDKLVPPAKEKSAPFASEKSVSPASEKSVPVASKKDSAVSVPVAAAPGSPAAPLSRTRARNKETRLDAECDTAAEPGTPPEGQRRRRRQSESAELRRLASETERLRRLDEELRLLDEEGGQPSPAQDDVGDGFSELEDEDDDGDATYKGTVDWNDSAITALVRSSVVKEMSKEREQKRRLSNKEAEKRTGVPESAVKSSPPEAPLRGLLAETSKPADSNKDKRVETGNSSLSTGHTPARKLPAGKRDGEDPPAKKRRESSPAPQPLVLPPKSPGVGDWNSGLKTPTCARTGDVKPATAPGTIRADDGVKQRDKQAPGRPAASKQYNENASTPAAATPAGGLDKSGKGGITPSTDGKRVSAASPGGNERPGASLSASTSDSAVGKRQRKLPKRFLDADTIFFSESAPLMKSTVKLAGSATQAENSHSWDNVLEFGQLPPEHSGENIQESEEGRVKGETSSSRQEKPEASRKYKHLNTSEGEREGELQTRKKIKIVRDTVVVERHPSSVGIRKREKSRDEEQETAPPKKRRKSREEAEEAEEPPRPITFQQPNKRKPIVFVSPIRKDQPETPVLPSMSAARKLTLDVASPKVRKVVMKVVVKPGPDGSPVPTISKHVSKPVETSPVSQRQGLKPGSKVLVKPVAPKPAAAAAQPPPAVPQTSADDVAPMTILTPGADVVIEDGPVIINDAGELVPARTQQDHQKTVGKQQDNRRTVRISGALPPTAVIVKRKPGPATEVTSLFKSPSASQITVKDSPKTRIDVASVVEESSVADVAAVKDKDQDGAAELAVSAEEVTPAAVQPPAKDTPATPVAVVGKRRRGRPPKNSSGVSTPSTATPENTPKVSPESEGTLPKRRGRPRKDSAAAVKTPAKPATPATGKKRGRKPKREPTPEPEPAEEEEPEEVTLDLSSLIGGAVSAAAADDVGYFDVNGQFVERSPVKGLDVWAAGYGFEGAPIPAEGMEDLDGSSTINMLDNPLAHIDGEVCEDDA